MIFQIGDRVKVCYEIRYITGTILDLPSQENGNLLYIKVEYPNVTEKIQAINCNCTNLVSINKEV